MKWPSVAAFTVVLLLATGLQPRAQESEIVATVHPPLPDRPAAFWFVPETFPASSPASRTEPATEAFARGVRLIEDGKYAAGLPLVSNADVAGTALANYAQFYRAVALAGTGNQRDAANMLIALD